MRHVTLISDHAAFKGDLFSKCWDFIIAYLCTTLDHSGFSRSRDMVGARQDLNGSRDLTMPLSGMICHPRARTCYDQRAYQIWSLYLQPPWRYEQGYKMWKMWWFWVDRGHPRTAYKFLWTFHGNYIPILHRFWDIARYWPKVVDFNLPQLYLAPPLRVTPLEFCREFWHQ